jgi:hypothetical protein
MDQYPDAKTVVLAAAIGAIVRMLSPEYQADFKAQLQSAIGAGVDAALFGAVSDEWIEELRATEQLIYGALGS